MLAVAKSGKYVGVEGFEREGSSQRWGGMHRWDFSVGAGGAFLMAGRDGRGLDVRRELSHEVSEVSCSAGGRTIQRNPMRGAKSDKRTFLCLLRKS